MSLVNDIFDANQPCRIIDRVVSPDDAAELLKYNTKNFRVIDKSRVSRYADDMKSGKWNLNGETIQVGPTALLNGQHRLTAIVKAGVPIRLFIAVQIEDDTAMTMDDGKPRTAASWLRHKGVSNFNNVAAMSRLCIIHDRRRWGNSSVGVDGGSRTEIVNFAMKHSDAIQGAHSLSAKCKKILPQSMMGAVMFIAARYQNPINFDTLTWFAESLSKGQGLTNNDPVLHLRERLITATGAKKIPSYFQRMLLSSAWNKTALGEGCKQLKFATTGPRAAKPISQILATPEL